MPAVARLAAHPGSAAEGDAAEVEQQRAHGRLENLHGGGAQRAMRGQIQFAGHGKAHLAVTAFEAEGQSSSRVGGGFGVNDLGALSHDEPFRHGPW